MDIVNAVKKFVNRADRIDINPITYSHVVSIADDKIDIMFAGTKSAGPSRFNEREDGIVELGADKSEKTFIEDGEVYIEFKGVEIFKSDNNEVVSEIVDLIQDRYESLKGEYRQDFIDLTERETSPMIVRDSLTDL